MRKNTIKKERKDIMKNKELSGHSRRILNEGNAEDISAIENLKNEYLSSFEEEIKKSIKEFKNDCTNILTSAKNEAITITNEANQKLQENLNKEENLKIKETLLKNKEDKLDKNDLHKQVQSMLATEQKDYLILQTSIKNLNKEKETIINEAKEAAENIVNSSKDNYKFFVSEIKKLVKNQEEAFKKCIEKERDDFNKKQKDDNDQLEKKSKQLAKKEEELTSKEKVLLEASSLKSIEEYRSLLEDLEKEFKKQSDINEELRVANERTRISQTTEQKEKIKKEIEKWENEERKIFSTELAELQKANNKLREDNARLATREATLIQMEAELGANMKTCEIKLQKLNRDEENLKDIISKSVKEEIADKDERISKLTKQLEDTIKEKNDNYEKFLRVNALLRDKSINPETIDEKNKQISKLKDDLTKKDEEYKNKNIDLQTKADSYDRLLAEHIDLKKKYAQIDLKNKEYISNIDQVERSEAETQLWKKQFLDLAEELNRRKDPTKEQRIASLTRSIPDIKEFDGLEEYELHDEIKWLESIKKDSDSSGIYFSNRIINAYHTSMKIHDWSPLTVLAGVSGTGKSELPRQYANHGGMYFISIAVKPDWDSPSSLFGYYNSIENKFQPTELLKVLYNAQIGKKSILSDKMVLVLLDEMNLAHVELYFADLLSKFEYIRGTRESVKYEIDLGAGCEPEILQLGNNILWTGTMNEDETTKALSDKVIDRSTLISFPRPKVLYDRKNTENVPAKFYISQNLWQHWVKSGLSIEQINSKDKDLLQNYKEIVQSINDKMSKMGRNLGHRVWQSITNYMLNHPMVIKYFNENNVASLKTELHKSFSEAIVFKIMPKLRGVETKGGYEEFINDIKSIIDKNIPELSNDFINATRLPSGLFQWCSAEFLEEKVNK